VHGFCGIWGVLAVGLFSKDKGLFYGAEGSLRLMGVQMLGVVVIILWVSTISGIFFSVSNQLGLLRLQENEEIIGADIHYFGPIELVEYFNKFDNE